MLDYSKKIMHTKATVMGHVNKSYTSFDIT